MARARRATVTGRNYALRSRGAARDGWSAISVVRDCRPEPSQRALAGAAGARSRSRPLRGQPRRALGERLFGGGGAGRARNCARQPVALQPERAEWPFALTSPLDARARGRGSFLARRRAARAAAGRSRPSCSCSGSTPRAQRRRSPVPITVLCLTARPRPLHTLTAARHARTGAGPCTSSIVATSGACRASTPAPHSSSRCTLSSTSTFLWGRPPVARFPPATARSRRCRGSAPAGAAAATCSSGTLSKHSPHRRCLVGARPCRCTPETV